MAEMARERMGSYSCLVVVVLTCTDKSRPSLCGPPTNQSLSTPVEPTSTGIRILTQMLSGLETRIISCNVLGVSSLDVWNSCRFVTQNNSDFLAPRDGVEFLPTSV